MSASIVRKGLQIVDPAYNINTGRKKRHKKKCEVFGLIPENYKYIVKRKGGKGNKINLLSANSKLTVSEARKKFKTKEQILKENLKKLEIIEEASKVEIDKNTLNQIIERAVTGRPVSKVKKVKKKDKKTTFTEEDFKKFEEAYFDE